jgi:hypothetical protein
MFDVSGEIRTGHLPNGKSVELPRMSQLSWCPTTCRGNRGVFYCLVQFFSFRMLYTLAVLRGEILHCPSDTSRGHLWNQLRRRHRYKLQQRFHSIWFQPFRPVLKRIIQRIFLCWIPSVEASIIWCSQALIPLAHAFLDKSVSPHLVDGSCWFIVGLVDIRFDRVSARLR